MHEVAQAVRSGPSPTDALSAPDLLVDGLALLFTEGRAAAKPVLSANQKWLGPGGESILLHKDGDIIVYHAYDAKTGIPSLQISTLTWADDWPHAALDANAANEKR